MRQNAFSPGQRSILVLATMVFSCLGISACSGSNSPAEVPSASSSPASSTGRSDSPPATAGPPTEVPIPDVATPLIADPNLVDPHSTPFFAYSRTGERGDRLVVGFTSGTPECYGADATVTESDTTVTIALRTGTRPDAVGKVCDLNAVYATLEVPLDAALGNRTVVSSQ